VIEGVDDKLIFSGCFTINSGRSLDLPRPVIDSERWVADITEHIQRVRDSSCFTDVVIDRRHCDNVDWSRFFLDDRRAVRVGDEARSDAVDRLDCDGDSDDVEQRRNTVVTRLQPQLDGRRQAPILGQRPPDRQLAARRVYDEAIVDVAADDVVDESSDAWS